MNEHFKLHDFGMLLETPPELSTKYQTYCQTAVELEVEPVSYEVFCDCKGNICFSPRAGRR